MKFTNRVFTSSILSLWILVFLGTLLFFHYLLSHPSLALWVESVQPSAAYHHGKEKIAEGEFKEAIASFQKGQAYFQQLYKETGLERMKVQWAMGVLLEANAFKDYGSTQDRERAIKLYEKVVQAAPYLSEGQPCVSLGELYQEKEEFQKALAAYEGGVKWCGETYLMDAYFGRGYCLQKLGKVQSAAQNLYYYARYTEKDISKWILDFLASFPDEEAAGDYIRGFALMKQGEIHQAGVNFHRYAKAVPEDYSAQYYLSVLENQEYKPAYGLVPESQIFPPSTGDLRELGVSVVDFYVPKTGIYKIQMELASRKRIEEVPIVELFLLHKKILSWTIDQKSFELYESQQNFSQGRNILWIQSMMTPEIKPSSKVLLRAISWGRM